MNEKLNQTVEMIDGISNDPSVPRNIKRTLSEVRERLLSSEEMNVKISAAIYMVESISDDINMPAHARTQIWAIINALESLKTQ